jgi:tetratricopeptide (TPR) repeat protein
VGSYSFLCAGGWGEVERLLGEAEEIAGDDPTLGAGLVLGCPYAWALMAKGLMCRDNERYEEAEALFKKALRVAAEQGDPETESWTRGNLSIMLGMRGDLDAGLALAQRNYELTEQLGDVFSRTWALFSLGWARLASGDAEGALDALEHAERLFRDAMKSGGEAEAWRGATYAEALLAAGRGPEALAEAERCAGIARERGMLWALPRALRVLALVRIELGESGAMEALEEAAEVAEQVGYGYEVRLIDERRRAVTAG